MKKVLLFMAVMSMIVFSAEAATQIEVNHGRAMNDIKVGMRLMNQAQQLTARNPAPQAIAEALDLYVEAGKLFEQAEDILIAMDKRAVNPKDIEGCKTYQKICLEGAQQLSQRLSSMKRR